MRRWITIMVGGLFLAVMALLPGSAQAAVAQPPARTVSASATPSPVRIVSAQTGPDIGGDIELFAADAGIVAAVTGVGVGILYYQRRRRDKAAVFRLMRLEAAINRFRKTTDEYRMPTPQDGSMTAVPGEKAVQDSALELVEAAWSCGEHGEKAVDAARQLMIELGVEWPRSSELVAIQAELRNVKPSEARKMIEG